MPNTRKWRVTVLCCTSGNCVTCMGGFHKQNRRRSDVCVGVTRAYADRIADFWRVYEPEIEDVD